MLIRYDNMSYMTEAVFHEISDLLELKRADEHADRKRLLDFGSGIAGPMRSVARVSDCDAFGMELQADLAEAANELSKMCGMDGSRDDLPCCKVMEGNLLKMDISENGTLIYEIFELKKFDALLSTLVILHIPKEDRPPIFEKMVQVLKPGAPIVIEDYVMLKETGFSPAIEEKLVEEVYAQDLATEEVYRAQLEAAGLVDIKFIDLTATWTDFVTARRNNFIANKDSFVRIQSQRIYDDLLRFYDAVVACFESGELGGFRITARTPKA